MRLLRDGLIIAASLIAAWGIVRSSLVDYLILMSDGLYVLDAFVGGLFFTSVFTTAPAIAFLVKLGQIYPAYAIALVGGVGALLGDLIIFSFIKNNVREDIYYLFSKSKSRRLRHLFDYRFVRWSLAFLGALVIASPLPDELGLALMGMSNISPVRFVLISYTFNTIGIFLIAYIAGSI